VELKEKAVSKKQQRFFGMVRAAQKGEGAASPEVAKVASEISKKDAKDFAKTKHKGLPEKKKVKEQNELAGKFKIDTSAHKKVQKKAKLRNLAKGNANPNEKAAAQKKAGGPKLYGEEENFSQRNKELKATKKARDERYKSIHSATNTSKNTDVNEGRSFADWKKAAGDALKRKKEERKAQPATDAGARARRKLKDKEHKKYVNFLPAEDD